MNRALFRYCSYYWQWVDVVRRQEFIQVGDKWADAGSCEISDLQPLDCWDRGFESRRGMDVRLSRFLCCVGSSPSLELIIR
jgi:hypothetical protein